QDAGHEPEGARPGRGSADPQLAPRETAGDPEEDAEDDPVDDELADRDVVVVERVAWGLPAGEALCVVDRRERPDEGGPGDELAVRHGLLEGAGMEDLG